MVLPEGIGIGFLWTLAKDAVRFIRGRNKKQTPEEQLRLQAKWKPVFADILANNFSKKIRSDVVIRDVARLAEYPDIVESESGISPWFRVSLIGAYHRGILVGLQWCSLVEMEEGEYRYFDYVNEDPKADLAFKALLVGKIPYYSIENLDVDGDEFYGYPHIYCKFSEKGPYEELEFCLEHQLFQNSLPHYSKIADRDAVNRASAKYGMPYPMV